MNLFALSDLHLSFGAEKPMDIFGGWANYTDRIKANWSRLVEEDDIVVIPGDISWAINFEEAKPDFQFINSLKGKKIILKGNHDYWWQTVKKINEFLNENKFDTISLVHNSCIPVGDFAVCGTRGWLYDGSGEKDSKVIARECGRLKKSIEEALSLSKKPIVFLHYPPVYNNIVCREIFAIIKQYGITDVYYGHIHGAGLNNSQNEYDGVNLHLVSCDCVDFTPVFITKF